MYGCFDIGKYGASSKRRIFHYAQSGLKERFNERNLGKM